MKNSDIDVDIDKLLDTVLSRCKEQSAFYRKIAYNADYKDETIRRIVDLQIAYDDVCSFIESIFIAEVKRQQADVANATDGFPTDSRATACNGNDNNIQERTAEQDVNSVDVNEQK